MGGGGRNGNGHGKGFARNVTKPTPPWVCKPCNWRNPHAANYCNKCGKAKQWVVDKDTQPAEPQAAALKKATEDMRKEFNKEVKELKN